MEGGLVGVGLGVQFFHGAKSYDGGGGEVLEEGPTVFFEDLQDIYLFDVIEGYSYFSWRYEEDGKENEEDGF